jgi:hypothetical protein
MKNDSMKTEKNDMRSYFIHQRSNSQLEYNNDILSLPFAGEWEKISSSLSPNNRESGISQTPDKTINHSLLVCCC